MSFDLRVDYTPKTEIIDTSKGLTFKPGDVLTILGDAETLIFFLRKSDREVMKLTANQAKRLIKEIDH